MAEYKQDVHGGENTSYKQVRADLGKRYRLTLVHGRYSTPVEVILRMLLCRALYGWSYEETRGGWPAARFSRVYFQMIPAKSKLICWWQNSSTTSGPRAAAACAARARSRY